MAPEECDKVSTYLILFFEFPLKAKNAASALLFRTIFLAKTRFLKVNIFLKSPFNFKTIFQYKDRPFLV